MPATDLKALRSFVANILDYDPTSEVYARQVDDILQEADRQICSEHPYPFNNQSTDVTAYKDRTANITAVSGSTQITTGTAFFETWMVNKTVELDGGDYTIQEIIDSQTAHISPGFLAPGGVYTGTVIHRYLDLPGGCAQVLGIARRSATTSPTTPGPVEPLTRCEDEWQNLPLGEVGAPRQWIFGDPVYLPGPRVNFKAEISSPGGPTVRGSRTVEFTSTFIRGGRESSHGQVVSLAATTGDEFVLTPFTSQLGTGLYKRYYFRCTEYGYNAWRLLEDPTAGNAPFEIEPNDVAPRTLSGLYESTLTESESLWQDERMTYPDGYTERIRLYPRQDEDYVFTIRYVADHQPMREDGDVSAIPPKHRMIIAYRALADVLPKHGNPTLGELYRKRFEAALLLLNRRFLSTPSARIVKGGWRLGESAPRRAVTLVHT